MHGTTMVFLVGCRSSSAFANYLVPLMIGARDLAFPRLNAFGFWLSALGGLLLYFSFIGGMGMAGAGSAPDVGWFAYAPLTGQSLLEGPQHGLLDSRHHDQRLRLHRHCRQHRHDDRLHALPGHDA